MSCKELILLSGGMDSATCLASAVKSGNEVYTMFFDYGQHTAYREHDCFVKLNEYYGIDGDHSVVVTSEFLKLLFSKSGLVDATKLSTEVPFRNGVFISMGASLIFSFLQDENDVGMVTTGISCKNDIQYSDCSEMFVTAMALALFDGSKQKATLHTPLLQMTKKEIYVQSKLLNVPLELTYSCYNDPVTPCGYCDSCKLRLEGTGKL